MINKYLKTSWNVLVVGLQNDWITSKQVIKLINENQSHLNCNDDLLVDLNINDDDKSTILDLIRKSYEINEEKGVKEWQNSILFAIENSDISLEEKLSEIDLQWADFNYLNEWRSFIRYTFGGNANSNEEAHKLFLHYLKQLEIQ